MIRSKVCKIQKIIILYSYQGDKTDSYKNQDVIYPNVDVIAYKNVQ